MPNPFANLNSAAVDPSITSDGSGNQTLASVQTNATGSKLYDDGSGNGALYVNSNTRFLAASSTEISNLGPDVAADLTNQTFITSLNNTNNAVSLGADLSGSGIASVYTDNDRGVNIKDGWGQQIINANTDNYGLNVLTNLFVGNNQIVDTSGNVYVAAGAAIYYNSQPLISAGPRGDSTGMYWSLSGLTAGIISEGNGAPLLSFGINCDQLDHGYDSSASGCIFRMDVRTDGNGNRATIMTRPTSGGNPSERFSVDTETGWIAIGDGYFPPTSRLDIMGNFKVDDLGGVHFAQIATGDLPDPTANTGVTYYNTDTGALTTSNGTAWT